MVERKNRAKAYWRYKYLFHLLDLTALFAFLAIVQLSGISHRLRDLALSFCGNFYGALSTYIAALSVIYYLVALPLNLYVNFILEHNFSLSNQTLSGWLKDEVKKIVVSIVIFLISIDMFYAISRNFQNSWWIISSVCWLAFTIIFAKIFPLIIIPLFYKYNTLPNNELRNKILELARRLDIKVLDVFEINFSEKTKKSNAALVGWGDTRRIILADNLVNEFTPQEVEVVVAHEMAHYKLHHIWKLLLANAISTSTSFYLFSLAATSFARSQGANDPFDIAMFPAVLLFFAFYFAAVSPLQNGISRRLERNADLLALKVTGLKDAFISLMERLAEKNLSDKTPCKLIEFLLYDHPPISKRIKLAQNFLNNE